MTQYSGDLVSGYKLATAKPAGSAHLRLNFSEIVSNRFTLLVGGVRGDDSQPVDVLGENRNHSFNTNLVEISSVFEYNFLDFQNPENPQRWSPYVFAGVGIFRVDNESASEDFSRNQLAIPMGVGFKYRVGKQFMLEFETGGRKTFFDELDGISDGDTTLKDYQFGNPNDDDWYIYTGIRISYVLYKIPCPFPYIPNRSMMQR